jgi:arylsulfatase A-like enzyme
MAGASLEPPTLAQAARPNLVIVLVDDVGYNDVGWRNSYAKTPFLDGLLRNGSEPTVELLRHYTFSICSPTRSSLLTGRLPSHVNEFNHGAEFPEWKNSAVGGPPIGGIDLRMRLLPQLLKGAGYRTAHVGKWHLGSSQFAQTPSRRGFDESFGYLSGSMHT